MRLLLVVVATLAACSDDQEHAPPTPQPIAGTVVRGEPDVSAVVTDPALSGQHLAEAAAAPLAPDVRQPARQGRPIDITLRSTPAGAQVAVDGMVIGSTPAFWSGMADGHEHEFVFTMRGRAIARYRFVPVSSGVIHGRLDPIREDPAARAVRPPPEVVPPRPTMAPPMRQRPPGIDAASPVSPTAPIPGPVGPTPSAATVDAPVGLAP